MPTELPALSEADFQASILKQAKTFGWLCYHTYDSRRSAPGFPDLVLIRDGCLLMSELKTEKGRLTWNQKEWLWELVKMNSAVFRVDLWRPGDIDYIVSTLIDPERTRDEYRQRLRSLEASLSKTMKDVVAPPLKDAEFVAAYIEATSEPDKETT